MKYIHCKLTNGREALIVAKYASKLKKFNGIFMYMDTQYEVAENFGIVDLSKFALLAMLNNLQLQLEIFRKDLVFYKHIPKKLTEEQAKKAIELYITTELSYNDIGTLFNCTGSNVRYWIKKYGLKFPTFGWTERKKHSVCGVYILRNKINDLYYIGSSHNIHRRIIRHYGALNNGKHLNVRLQADFNLYGHENFEVTIYKVCKTDYEAAFEEGKLLEESKQEKLYNKMLVNIEIDIKDKYTKKLLANIITKDNGCWFYNKGKTNKDGYMILGSPTKPIRKAILAHRYSWVLHNNEQIPNGVIIGHKCNNKKCVNPEHLYLASSKQNADDYWLSKQN